MKLMKRLACVLTAAATLLPGLAQGLAADAAQTVTISPDATYAINDGVFEGWGTSLCWWANRLGYSDSLAQQAADAFYGDNGLRLNIARFNIGGGDDPSHRHITRTDSNMPGYTVYKNGAVTYDWNADYNQRNVLQRAIKAAGDDMIVEMFSNSPPYYMCKSGCSSGSVDGGSNNLKDDQYDDFARYLAEVCYHYETEWGVDIQSIDAMNEPYTNFWRANSYKQEGCHFDIGNSESTVILELQKALAAKGLGDIMISASDETNIDTQIQAYNALSTDAKNAISRIDTHTYSGSKRAQLKETALAAGKNLWMSEVDGGSTAGTNAGEMAAGLWLAERITTDMNDLNASAWVLWQVIDSHISKDGYNGNKDGGMVNTAGGYWGTAVADHDNNKIIFTKKYYTFGQYTRYIRPGMIMLESSRNTLAAYDPELGRVVVVAYNLGGSASDIKLDLSGFASVGTSAQAIRTSLTENWKDLGTIALKGNALETSLAANSVTTYIIDGCTGDAGSEIDLSAADLSGTKSWKDSEASDYRKAFDGDLGTYFDGLSAGWVQADLGKVYDLRAVGYCPRKGYEYRMADGFFQVSEDGQTWTTVHTISGKPSYGMHKVGLNGAKARYIRYAVPEGKPDNGVNADDSYCCNIAEIRLWGTLDPTANFEKLIPVETSGSAPWQNRGGYDQAKAFDGKTDTYFDGVGNGWLMADFGETATLNVIGYCPRSGYEARMVDSYFEVSKDGQTWEKVQTITRVPAFKEQYAVLETPVEARYVRYAVPEGKPNNGVNGDDVYCCNVAELTFYGSHGAPAPVIGDVDADGTCAVLDVVMLTKWLHEVGDLTDAAAADVNGDGVVDVFDLGLMKRLVLR